MPTLVKFWFWAFLAVAALIVIALTVKKAIDIRIASKAKKDAAVEPAPVEPAA
jgi:flagellar biosynthesis/type III secretory pathway M-ring protein FliF/YscJ